MIASKSRDKEPAGRDKGKVKLLYVEWSSSIASAYVVKTVIEDKLNYDCELTAVSLSSLWKNIADGNFDATISAWIPSLQRDNREKYLDQVDYLGANMLSAHFGLAVPEYVEIESINQLPGNSRKFKNEIIGIEEETGLMTKTKEVMQKYNLQDEFDLIKGSDATMIEKLKKAIEEQEWIVITAWTPHWIFARWDLKYLQDTKEIYGDKEFIGTVVRQGLRTDMPSVYNFFNKFYWDASNLKDCMCKLYEKDNTPQEAARNWIEENEKLVETWLS